MAWPEARRDSCGTTQTHVLPRRVIHVLPDDRAFVMTPPQPGLVVYVAETYVLVPDAPPTLLRNVRDEDGHVHEQKWLPREERWAPSWEQKEASLGMNNDDFTDVSEQQALAIQEARRRQFGQLDTEE